MLRDNHPQPLLRRIHKNKVVLIKWFDKQGVRSLTTHVHDPDKPLTRFVVTKDGYDYIEHFVVESDEPDDLIMDWMADNQVLAFGAIM